MSSVKLENHLLNSKNSLNRLKSVAVKPLDEDKERLDATVHRFNIAFEKLIDTFLVYSVEKDLIPQEDESKYAVNKFKIIELAFNLKFIDDDKIWVSILRTRNATSHEYSEEQAMNLYLRIKSYIPYFESLYEKMVN